MVEKVFISPNRVRAYGNIVNMKTGDDFTLVNSELTVTTDTVDGAEMTVFSMEVEPRITVTATNPYMVSGETTDLVVTLQNVFGSPLSGKTVTVSDGTSVYNGITNNNGTYTKTGVSVTSNATFTASYNGATSSCDVYYPCLFVDYGTTTSHNDKWDTWGSYSVTRTRSVESTLIEPVDRTTASYQIKYIHNMSSPSIIEFDCCQVGGATNSIIFQLRGNNQSVIRQIALSSYTNLSLGEWYHWKVDLVNGTFTNETTNQPLTFNTGSIISFFFVIQANAQHNLKYKNFVIY